MKILAVSYMLPPMLFPQAVQVGRLLYHSEHEIFAVSGSWTESSAVVDDRIDFDHKVRRLAVPFSRRMSGHLHLLGIRLCPLYGALPDIYRSWVAPAYDAVERFLQEEGVRPDLLVTFGEPMSDHLLGLRLKRRLQLPWLAHFSDPWSDNPFRRLQPLSMRLNRRLERQVIAAADACVFTCEETRDLVMRKYGRTPGKPALVLPHAYDPVAFQPDMTASCSTDIVLRYVGNFYGFRSPYPLFRALAYLARTDPVALANVRVELIGNIPPRMLSSGRLRRLPPGLVAVKPSVSYRESLRLMRTADVLLTIDAPAKNSVFFPSKLVDYIGAGRSLLGIVSDGAARRIIESCGGTTVSPSASTKELAIILGRVIAVARTRKGAGGAIPEEIAGRYSIDRVAKLFDALCSMLARDAANLSHAA